MKIVMQPNPNACGQVKKVLDHYAAAYGDKNLSSRSLLAARC
ncbi:MAG: hypothetical protein PHD32_02605 [Eubacteriales bacterium]|nr:hypothetical protein [Eubacteriales bacterium]